MTSWLGPQINDLGLLVLLCYLKISKSTKELKGIKPFKFEAI